MMAGIDYPGLNMPNPYQQKIANAHPYVSSVASSASSSSSSVFSLDGVSSQSSISSLSTHGADTVWEHEALGEGTSRAGPLNTSSCEPAGRVSRTAVRASCIKTTDAPVPPELRMHPRRTTSSHGTSASGPRHPPSLVRQNERKINFVDNLVDSAAQLVETIWPLSVVAPRSSDSSANCKGVLPLRTFIQETLRRSRTSYSTLQVALYYLIKIRPHVPSHNFTTEQPRDKPAHRAMQCGRRMFLAALILASKYLQDRNYSARAWSKISGLNTTEINQNEMMFLQAVNWELHIPQNIYHKWTSIVLKYTSTAGGPSAGEDSWRNIIPKLTPDLDIVDIEPSTPSSCYGFDTMPESPSPSRSSSVETPNDQTPTNTRVQQPQAAPRLDAANQSHPTALPSLPKLGLLPTPQLTPQCNAAWTPAASAPGCPLRRTSIGAAMSHAQSMSLARSTLDQRPSQPLLGCRTGSTDSYPFLTRRSSLARSASTVSSPESMISDVSTVSSRSSRSSSISSCSSSTAASSQARLAVTATRRCATNMLKECRKNLAIQTPIDESAAFCQSPETTDLDVGSSVADLSSFSLNTPADVTACEAAQGLCELSAAATRSGSSQEPVGNLGRRRKRGRTPSQDLSLQRQVRQLMAVDSNQGQEVVLPDRHLPDSFLVSESKGPSASLEGQYGTMKYSIPIAQPGSIKRACCSFDLQHIVNSDIRRECMNLN